VIVLSPNRKKSQACDLTLESPPIANQPPNKHAAEKSGSPDLYTSTSVKVSEMSEIRDIRRASVKGTKNLGK